MRWNMLKQRILAGLYRLFRGRYGADQLSVVLLALAVLFSLAARLTGQLWLGIFYYGGIFYALWRMLSRNYSARSRENRWLLSRWGRCKKWIKMLGNRFRDRKNYRYLKCPSCGQYLRVPKGKGKIEIRCSSCQSTFIRKV